MLNTEQLVNLSLFLGKVGTERQLPVEKAQKLGMLTLALKNINDGISVADKDQSLAAGLIGKSLTTFQILFEQDFFPKNLGKITLTGRNPNLPNDLKVNFMRTGFDSVSDAERAKYEVWDNAKFTDYINQQFS